MEEGHSEEGSDSITETGWKGIRNMTLKNCSTVCHYIRIAANSHSETLRAERGDVLHPQIYVLIYVCKENGKSPTIAMYVLS